MLLFGLLGLLLVGSIFVCIKADTKWYNDGLFFTSIFTGVISLVILIGLVCNVPWKKDIELDKAKYNELVIKVSQVSKLDSEFLPVLQKDLMSEITNMNMYIEKNRIYHDSWWLGWLYSEEIGNLQKINYIPEGN